MVREMARIDDVLEQVGRRRQQVLELLPRLSAPTDDRLGLRRAARKLRLLAPDAALILVDHLLEGGADDTKLILQLLPEMQDFRIRERLQDQLSREDLSDDLRRRLEEARAVVERQLVPFGLPDDLDRAASDHVWRYVAGNDWQTLSLPRLGQVWLENFFPQAQRLRRRLLDELIGELGPDSLPVLELEAQWGGKMMFRWTIEQLRQFSAEQVRPILTRLSYHRETDLRELARQELKKQPAAMLSVGDEESASTIEVIEIIEKIDGGNLGAAAPDENAEPSILCFATSQLAGEKGKDAPKAKMGAKPVRGIQDLAELTRNSKAGGEEIPRQLNLLLVEKHPNGESSFFSLLIDLQARGIVECFGMEGVVWDEIAALLESFNAQFPEGHFRQIPSALGLLMAHIGAAKTVQGRQALPRDYYLWRPIWMEHPYEATAFGSKQMNEMARALPQEWRGYVFKGFEDPAAEPRPW